MQRTSKDGKPDSVKTMKRGTPAQGIIEGAYRIYVGGGTMQKYTARHNLTTQGGEININAT